MNDLASATYVEPSIREEDRELVATMAPMPFGIVAQRAAEHDFSLFFKWEDLQDDTYMLSVSSISILIEFDIDGAIAYYKPVNLYGFGDSITKAIDELKGDIIDLHKEFQKTPDEKLGELPKEWKAHLAGIIRKK